MSVFVDFLRHIGVITNPQFCIVVLMYIKRYFVALLLDFLQLSMFLFLCLHNLQFSVEI